MFNNLLSNLPFNPSLIDQVGFYSRRLRQEASIRRLGFTLMVLVMLVQLFAVLGPTQPSLAESANDLVPGGFTSKTEAVQACTSDSHDYKTILGHFGISCDNVANANVISLRSTDSSNTLYSMGRVAQGSVNQQTGKVTNEVEIDIAINGVSQPFYMRLLSSWDKSGTTSTYSALSVGNVFGVHYYLLFNCGNVVQIGKPTTPVPVPTPIPKPKPTPQPTPVPITTKPIPTPVPTPQKPCPAATSTTDTLACLSLSKTARNVTQNIANANNSTANAGDVIQYTLSVKNAGKATQKAFVVREDLTDVLEYADVTNPGGATQKSTNVYSWPPTDIAAGATIQKQFSVKVKNPIPATPAPCNPAVVHPCPTSGTGDLTMTNVYGTTVSIKLQPPVAKVVETVSTTTLPNTGAGSGLLLVFGLVVMVGYFFARSRLLARELDIVRAEYTSNGGA